MHAMALRRRWPFHAIVRGKALSKYQTLKAGAPLATTAHSRGVSSYLLKGTKTVFRAPNGFEVKCPDVNAAEHNVYDPATLEVISSVPEMGAEDATEAIQVCEEAMGPWSRKPAQERSGILERLCQLMHQNKEDLAHIITLECGKPLAEATGEVAYAASFFKWFAEEGRRAYGNVIPANSPSKRMMTVMQPVGVCAAITPWNFPAAMITRKLAPALATGCSMIVKPAEDTPLSALAIQNLAEEAGVPPGVIATITSSRENTVEIGDVLCESFTVRKLSFTGSTHVGKLLAAKCAGTVKRVSLELGGNAPFIVFDDADVEKAAEGAIASKFRNSGQTCVCANRIFVHKKVYSAFTEALSRKVEGLKVGHGLDSGVTQGPLINKQGFEKAKNHIEQAVSSGANTVLGGDSPADLKGYFINPTILTDVTPDMIFGAEETFGPIAGLIPFERDEEVIRWANDTTAGLAAYIFTRDVHRAFKVSERLQYGMVGVNDGIVSAENAPFGGIKESGLGREGGQEGIREYLDVKYMCFGGFE